MVFVMILEIQLNGETKLLIIMKNSVTTVLSLQIITALLHFIKIICVRNGILIIIFRHTGN